MIRVSFQTRPDVAFDVCQMSNTVKFPKVKLLFEANKALQKLKSRTGSITFPQLGRPMQIQPIQAWKMDLYRVVLSFLFLA